MVDVRVLGGTFDMCMVHVTASRPFGAPLEVGFGA